MHTITIWTFLNSLQADRTAPGLLAGGAGTPYKPFSLKAKTLAQEWLYHSEHFNPGGWSRELRFRYFKFTINCLETCPTVLLDRGAFAAFERFAKGKTSAQGEFTSPEQFKGPQVSKKEAPALQVLLFWRCHPDLNWGVELLQSSALPLGYGTEWSKAAPKNGASDEARTRYLHLGKVALYQMSYTRMLPGRGCPSRALFGWCLRSESNQRHEDFQSSALPTELQRQIFLFERLQAGKQI